MVNERLNDYTDKFAAHLQLVGELMDPGFSLRRQTAPKEGACQVFCVNGFI